MVVWICRNLDGGGLDLQEGRNGAGIWIYRERKGPGREEGCSGLGC